MRQALELALEALEGMQNAIYNIGGEHVIDLNYAVEKADVAEQAITAIKEALAQPEQEPVLVECGNCHEGLADMEHVCKKCLGAGWVNNPQFKEPEQETVAVEFEKMTGVPNAWNNPALMQVRNGFIGGWEAAQSKKSENFDTWMKNPYTKTIMESIKNDYQPKNPKNEPVAWYDKDGVITANPIEFSQPLYTTPPQRTWVGLTDDERNDLWWTTDIMKLTQAIEAKLRSKNNG